MNQHNDPRKTFLKACDEVIHLRDNGHRDNDPEITHRESLCIHLIPYISTDPEVIARITIADLPRVAETIVQSGTPITYPNMWSSQMKAIRRAVIDKGRVEALILLIDNGFVFSSGMYPTDFHYTIVDKDSPALFRLFITLLKHQYCNGVDLLDILEDAGDHIGEYIAASDKGGSLAFQIEMAVSSVFLLEITVKQFSWMVGAGIDIHRHYTQSDMDDILPQCALDVVRQTTSNHGRLHLNKVEPSFAAICKRKSSKPFFNMVSSKDGLLCHAVPTK